MLKDKSKYKGYRVRGKYGSYGRLHRVRKKKSIIKNRFFWSFILIFIFIGAGVYFLFFSQFFQIKKIFIFGNDKVSKSEITRIIERELKKRKLFFSAENIFLASVNTMKEDILDSFPQIAEVKVSRDFPDKLNFTVSERKPEAMFCEDYQVQEKEEKEVRVLSQKCFLLDKEGVIFEEFLEDEVILNIGLLKSDSSLGSGNIVRLPKVKKLNLRDKLRLGQEVIKPDLLSKILEIFSGLDNLKIPIKEIVVASEERLNIRTLDNWDIYFNSEKDIDWQFTKLEAVLKDISLEKRKDLEYIELRFGNLAPFKYREIEE